jgi:type VII secretion integral membrane protein EccD
VGAGTVGLAGLLFGALWYGLPPSGAAAILVVALVAGIGLAPLLAVRLGRLPLPVVTAAPEVIAAERHPSRSDIMIAVARADELLDGMLLGISVATLGGLVVLSRCGLAGPMLAGLAATSLLLRARLFPTVAARLPLLSAGLVGLAVTATGMGASAARLIGVAIACCAVVALMVTAATAHRRRPGGSPYLSRLADILDITAVVALAPVACAVLDLYSWVRGLAS